MTDSTSASDLEPLEKGPQETIEVDDSAQGQIDGGARAWLSVAGAAAAMFVSFGWINCIGLFQAVYEEDQLRNYSSSQISWITSTEWFCMLAFSPVAGILFDRYGPRIPLAIGSVMHAFGMMMLSLSTEYYQIMLSQSICSGIGSSMVFTPAMTAPQTWFKKKRAIALGLAVSGSSLGGVTFPLLARRLIPQLGFPWAVRICAFIVIGLLVFANLAVTSNLRHTKKPTDFMKFIRPLREAKFAIFCASNFFLYWAMTIPITYIVTNAVFYGMNASTALYLVPIFNGASFFGRTIPNLISEKAGRYNTMTTMLLMSAILVLSLWFRGRSDGAFITFAVVFGFSSGAGIGLGPVLISSISPISELGYRTGIVLLVGAFGILVSPPVAGAIKGSDGGSYEGPCILSGVTFLIAAAGVATVRVMLGGWSIRAKV